MKRKRYLRYIFLMLLLCLVLSCQSYSGGKASADELLLNIKYMDAQDVGEKVLRLHIVANSNSEADQLIKLKIRDEITKKYSYEFSSAPTKEDAQNLMNAQSGEIAELTNEILAENGFDYSCRIVIGQEAFPDKVYGGLLFPSGEYDAVKVILGEGKGQNWWCVLYPPLCFLNADSDEESKKYAAENGGRIQVRSRMVEWIKALKSSASY